MLHGHAMASDRLSQQLHESTSRRKPLQRLHSNIQVRKVIKRRRATTPMCPKSLKYQTRNKVGKIGRSSRPCYPMSGPKMTGEQRHGCCSLLDCSSGERWVQQSGRVACDASADPLATAVAQRSSPILFQRYHRHYEHSDRPNNVQRCPIDSWNCHYRM